MSHYVHSFHFGAVPLRLMFNIFVINRYYQLSRLLFVGIVKQNPFLLLFRSLFLLGIQLHYVKISLLAVVVVVQCFSHVTSFNFLRILKGTERT